MSLLESECRDMKIQLKELNRQLYFTSFEQRRKRLIIKQIEDEIQSEKKRKKIKKQFAKTAKEKVNTIVIPFF